MTKSLKVQDGKCIQHSEKDAVLVSILKDFESLSEEIKISFKILLLVFQKLCFETMSGDVLYLSFCSVKDMIDQIKDKEQRIIANEFFKKLVLIAEDRKNSNPLSKMF
jgi:hypothetical protein